MTAILVARGQLPPGEMDLAEIAAFLDTALAEDGAPDRLRLDVINAAGMLMRELKLRRGWDDPSAIAVPMVLDSIFAEARRVCQRWFNGDYEQLPSFRTWLAAADLLVNFAARSGHCVPLDRTEVDAVHRYLYPVGTPRLMTDLNCRVLYADRSLANWLGCEPGDLHMAHLIDDLVPDWFRHVARERLDCIKAGQQDQLVFMPTPLNVRNSREPVWVSACRSDSPIRRVHDALGRHVSIGIGLQRVPAAGRTRVWTRDSQLASVYG